MHVFPLALSAALGAPVEGTWHARGAAEVAEQLRGAVEAAVSESFSAAERPVARWLLLRATRPCDTVEVELRDAAVAIRCDGQRMAIAPGDGTPVSFAGADGRPLTVAHDVVDERTVTQSFQSREGTRTSRLTARPDGTLEVAVSIRSRRLAGPLEYTVTYGR